MNGEREVRIGKQFATGTRNTTEGLLVDASAAYARERKTVVRVIGDGDMLDFNWFAECMHFHHLCKRVYLLHLDGKTWCTALDRVRVEAEGQAMAPEMLANAWQRAYGESQRKACARFLRETDFLA